MTSAGKFHRYAGYLTLFILNGTAMSGISHYFNDIVDDKSLVPLGPISLMTFALMVIVCEICYRRSNCKSQLVVETPLQENKNFMSYTPEQIDKGVAAGIPLLIFDNLVLNLNGYDKLHPGGKFFLRQNLGRDISKFFNGGYSLVQGPGIKPHHHSAHALTILQSLIVGVLHHQKLVKEETFRISDKARVTDSTFTFTFTQKDNMAVHNLKRWYSDLAMMGRHFLVSSKRFPKIKRHYTICSSMRPELFQELISLAQDALSGKQIEFNMGLLDTKNQDKICLTLKNYKMAKGVSTQIHHVVPVLDPPEQEINNFLNF